MATMIAAFTVVLTSCSKEKGCTDEKATNYDPGAEENDGSCESTGEVVFWQHSEDNFNITTVTINGVSKEITKDDDDSAPDHCGEIGNATFSLPIGIYSYTATEKGTSKEWSYNNLVIERNECTKRRLLK